jgi:hypothetical protein
VARFFYLLAKAKLTSASALKQMRTYHNLTAGFGAGGGKYGLGLLSLGNSYGQKPQQDVTGKIVNWTDSWGHLGEDWGSSMQFNGYFPNLGVAMTLATNAEQEMNFSKGHPHGSYGDQRKLQCQLENAVLNFVHPSAPRLAC